MGWLLDFMSTFGGVGHLGLLFRLWVPGVGGGGGGAFPWLGPSWWVEFGRQ